MRRSNLLVLAGIAFFVVGVVIVALVSRDNGGSSAKSAGTVDVLVAKDDIPSGTNGTDALTKVEVRRVNTSDKQPDALSTPSELSNQIFSATFSKNEQIRSGGLRARSATPTVQVPDGKQAIAVNVPFVAGGAGYLAPGDLVNVFEVYPTAVADSPVSYPTPRTQLMLTNVKVLDVQQQVAPLSGSSSSTPSSTGVVSRPTTNTGSYTVLLALDSIDAEKVIFGSSTTGLNLYLTRVGDNAAPSTPTPGRDYTNILSESPQAAFQRENP